MKSLIYIIPFILFGCIKNKEVKTLPAPLYPSPQKIKLLPGEYDFNAITKDTIDVLLTEIGETLVTGRPINVIKEFINMDSLVNPKIVIKKGENNIVNAYSNQNKIPNKIPKIQVNKNSLTIIPFEEIKKNDTSHYLVSSIGDTIPTGTPIPTQGKVVPCIRTQSIIALSPRFKEAARNNLKYLDVEQGMSSSAVICILEDKRGDFWFGGTSGGGVCKYDGTTFTYFTQKEGLSNNAIFSILEDKQGNIWFGTDGGGVNKYDGNTFTHFTQEEGMSSNTVFSILEDREGNLWFGTYKGVSKYDGKNFTHYTTKEGLSNNHVNSIYEDKKGNLWFGTNYGGVTLYDGKNFTHYTTKEGLSNNSVFSILEDKEENLWFGTNGGGISVFDGEYFTHYSTENGLNNNYIRSICESSQGDIFLGTDGGGVNIYNGEYFTYITNKEGLNNNYIYSIVEGRDGTIWFGTYGGGVCMYKKESFVVFNDKQIVGNNSVYSIFEDSKHQIWIGTKNGGVSKFDGKSFTHYTKENGLSSNTIYSIIEDKKGNIWFGTYGAGVNKFDGKTFTYFDESNGLCNNYIRFILEDKEGNIWFATKGGVSVFNGEKFIQFKEKSGLSEKAIMCILEDKKGNIWFGSWEGGVTKFDGESFTHFTEKDGLSNNTVFSMMEDEDENIWFGTYGGGVSIFDGKYFTCYTEKEGLSNNYVWSIIEDKNKNVWMSTEHGLNRFVYDIKESKYKIQQFLENDGLKGVDFYANSYCLDSKDRLWWGSGKGLTMLKDDNFKIESPPTVLLREIDVNESFIDYHNVTDTNIFSKDIIFNGAKPFENYPLNLELPYNKNHITFRFSAIDWVAPHKIQYSYVLEGQNTNWSQPSQEPKADYRNLEYGDYTFKICAIGESGEWSKPIEYKFIIHPPWWKTIWFRTIVLLSIVGLLYLLYKWRIAKLEKKQKELELEIEIATGEIRNQKNEAEKQRDEVSKQKEIIEEVHKEITDSIRYAKRIQNAILPPLNLVKEFLPQSFILYKPKDVVAGDFYWMEQVENKILFAAADCTGHGVPGAMVSVICNNGLNRSVREYNLSHPNEILDKTRELVISEFEKSEEEVKDGMDIALCSLDYNSIELKSEQCKNSDPNAIAVLHYSGAHNPLWIIRDNEIIEIKADKQPIGKYDYQKPFTNHMCYLCKGDTIYIFSDGYVDQFGGLKGKKFKAKAFRELLLSIQDKTMIEQSTLINDTFEKWKGNMEQIDDVCVIGVKI